MIIEVGKNYDVMTVLHQPVNSVQASVQTSEG